MTIRISTSAEEVFKINKRNRQAWEERIDRMSRAVEQILTVDSWLSVFTTGSDGRLENKSYDSVDSNPELSVYTNSYISEREREEIVRKLRNWFNRALDYVEVRNPSRDTPLIVHNGNPNLIFPTRIWDNRMLLWEIASRKTLLGTLSDEIIANPDYSRKFYHRLRNHKSIMFTGKQVFQWEEKKLVDTSEWIIRFDPKNGLFWVKPWPLRVIQYTLALWLMRRIRDHGHPPFADSLPTNIIERLDFIQSNRMTSMNSDEIVNLQYMYAFFLNMHHEMQYRNMAEWKTTFSVASDVLQDMEEMLECLQKTISPDKFFKI